MVVPAVWLLCLTEKAARGANHVHDGMVHVSLHTQLVMGLCAATLGHLSL